MPSTALEAHEDTKVGRSPIWVGDAAIHTLCVARQFLQRGKLRGVHLTQRRRIVVGYRRHEGGDSGTEETTIKQRESLSRKKRKGVAGSGQRNTTEDITEKGPSKKETVWKISSWSNLLLVCRLPALLARTFVVTP